VVVAKLVARCCRGHRPCGEALMGEAFGWGAIGASALLIGALIAYQFSPSRRVIAVVMALGTGLLVGSVSFELIDEGLKTPDGRLGRAAGPGRRGAFTVGNWLLERHGGGKRKDPSGAQAEGSPMRSCSGRPWTASPSRSCSASQSCKVG
jgi:ZIP family zinc transporter